MHALSVHGLTKTYNNGVQALRGLDLDVDEGDFFALLGPNGAGKTTLIGIVTSLVRKSGGKVTVFGHDIDQEIEAANPASASSRRRSTSTCSRRRRPSSSTKRASMASRGARPVSAPRST